MKYLRGGIEPLANPRAIFGAALLGGIVGGAFVWLVARTGPTPSAMLEGKRGRETSLRLLPPSEVAGSSHTRNRRDQMNLIPADVRLIEPARSSSWDQPADSAVQSLSSLSTKQPSLDASLEVPSRGPRQRRSITAMQNVTVVNTFASVAPGSTLPQKPLTLKEDAARIETALSYALQAAEPYVRQGFTVREDYWGGALEAGTTKTIEHQLFRGNEYWFWIGADPGDASPDVHIYDAAGEREETEHWSKPPMAAARIVPDKTGAYYLRIGVERRPAGGSTTNRSGKVLVHWALAYAFR